MKSDSKSFREPAVAGQFYSANANELQAEVDEYIAQARLQEIPGELIALISPHAGYVYSGWVAGYAYKSLVGKKFDTAIIVGLSHRYPISGAVICDTGAFMTPLGNVEIDSDLASSIVKNNGVISVNLSAHQYEHSLEVQLPFLQRVAPETKIVPMLINDADTETCDQVAKSIAKAIASTKKSVILIASTDLTHYPAYRYAVEVDKGAIAAMLALDVDKLDVVTDKWMNKGIPNLHCVVCSDAAVKVVIQASKQLGANKAVLLKYANSGDVAIGDKSQVVGYTAIAIAKTYRK
ncbi:MAG: AmmeMemoRadiSam system protein B [bacterium]|nr:AmmeMemoRadiSam system protein B [bacterium]